MADVKDMTNQQVGGDAGDKGEAGKPDDPKVKEAIEAQGRVNKLLEQYEFENLEELSEALDVSGGLINKLGNRDLDQLIKDADTLAAYNEYWKAHPASDGSGSDEGDSDDDDDKTTRLIQSLRDEVKELKDERVKEQAEKDALEASKNVLETYEKTATSVLEGQEIPKEHLPFIKEMMGIGNPAVDVDLDDIVAVKKMARAQLKKYNDFVNKVIKDYTDGKLKIVDVTPIEEPNPDDDKPKVKNLKDARKVLTELFTGKK